MQRTLVRAYREDPDVSRTDIGRALVRYEALDSQSDKRAMRRLWRDTGSDGVRVITNLDAEPARQLIRVIDKTDGLETKELRRTLRRVERIDEIGEVKEFISAKQANRNFIKEKRAEGANDPQPPHKQSSIVIQYETEEIQTVYRLWDKDHEDSNMLGEWTTTEGVVAQADGYEELEKMLASPDKFDYDSIAKVEVGPDTRMRMSTASQNFGKPGGGTQVRLIDTVPYERWEPLSSISEVGT